MNTETGGEMPMRISYTLSGEPDTQTVNGEAAYTLFVTHRGEIARCSLTESERDQLRALGEDKLNAWKFKGKLIDFWYYSTDRKSSI